MAHDREPNFYQMMLGLPESLRQPNYYQLLGLDPDSADDKSIRDAAADRNGKLLSWQNSKYYKQASLLMRELAEARAVLLDPAQKQVYDERLGRAAEEGPILLLEAAPEEEPILLKSVPDEAPARPARNRRRSSQPARREISQRTKPAATPRINSLVAGCVLMLLGLAALSWAAWDQRSVEPPESETPTLSKGPRPWKESPAPVSTAHASTEENSPQKIAPTAPEAPIAQENPPVAIPPIENSPPLAVSPFDEESAKNHQNAWAKHLNVPTETTNSLGMKLRLIPPGEFQMGSPPEEKGHDKNETLHLVRLTKPFLMSDREVTVGNFMSVLNRKPPPASRVETNEQEDLPIIRVTWFDCIDFCNQLSEKEGLEPYYEIHGVIRPREVIARATVTIRGGTGYRLPTEAEWEFACRAGTPTAYAFGDTLSTSQANIRIAFRTPPSILLLGGSRASNAFGLYDMHGNVSEWCFDRNDPELPPTMSQTDPVGVNSYGPYQRWRAARGGAYGDSALECRSANRHWSDENHRGSHGFRVVRGIGHSTASSHPSNGPTLAKIPFDAVQAKQFQADWAKSFGVPTQETSQEGIKLALIPAGEFLMGTFPADEHHQRDETQHRVRLTEPYYLGMTEVTLSQFMGIVGPARPLPMLAEAESQKYGNRPIQSVTWYDAVDFCNSLSEKNGFPPYYTLQNPVVNQSTIVSARVDIIGGEGYRLPTEAEWEFACRAGTRTATAFGNTLLPSQARFLSGPQTGPRGPIDVGTLSPNAFGLFDMHGNVKEWCFDYYDFRKHLSVPVENPIVLQRPTDMNPHNATRVERGGDYQSPLVHCRSAARFGGQPGRLDRSVGFRIARTPKRAE